MILVRILTWRNDQVPISLGRLNCVLVGPPTCAFKGSLPELKFLNSHMADLRIESSGWKWFPTAGKYDSFSRNRELGYLVDFYHFRNTTARRAYHI
jgi:hypothetical protein